MKDKNLYEELKRIEAEHGYLDPTVVVEEAASELSPLHSRFQWDDEIAGQKYRIWQARQLIKSVQVTYKGKAMPAFLSVKVNYEDDKSGYISTRRVFDSEELTRQTLSEAVKRIEYWQDIYGDLKELANIVDRTEIKKVKQALAHEVPQR